MVGWQESRLMDRHRFPKGIAGIGHGPEEGQKLAQGSRHLNKQADTAPRTHGAGNVPKIRRVDDQKASLVGKLIIPICSQCPESQPLGWGEGSVPEQKNNATQAGIPVPWGEQGWTLVGSSQCS